jgi:hypothetical protein
MTNLTRVSNNSPKLIIGEIKQILVEVREHPQFHPQIKGVSLSYGFLPSRGGNLTGI